MEPSEVTGPWRSGRTPAPPPLPYPDLTSTVVYTKVYDERMVGAAFRLPPFQSPK